MTYEPHYPNRDLSSMGMRSLMSEEEWIIFQQVFRQTCKHFPHIKGGLAIGSLIQHHYTRGYNSPKPINRKAAAYQKIVGNYSKLFPSTISDLDIWLLTTNPNNTSDIEDAISQAGIKLIDYLEKNPEKHGSLQWANLKRDLFRAYYKNPALYPDCNEPEPWMALPFKEALEANIMSALPKFTHYVNNRMEKKIPGDFLEIRAYPPCSFNLRPEGSGGDRSPRPMIANRDWISLEKNAFILLSDDSIDIHPFKDNGHILGKAMLDYIQ